MIPAVGDVFYKFLSPYWDGAHRLHVQQLRIIKVWKDYVFLGTVRPDGTVGSQRKVPHNVLLRDYSLTKGEAVSAAIEQERQTAIQARKTAERADARAEEYLQFMTKETL